MKRVVLILLSCLMLVLAGCDAADELPTGSQSASSGITEGPSGSPSDVIDIQSITFTSEHETTMYAYLEDCSYMIFSQTMTNGVAGQGVYTTTRYSFSINVKQQVQSQIMRYVVVNGAEIDGVGYSLYSDGINTIASEDGVWVKAGAKYEMQVWDLSRFSTDADVYRYLLHDLKLPIGVVGESNAGWWTFEVIEAAPASLIVGIDYDELLDASYKYTFRDRDGMILPDSVSVRVDYIVEGVQYYIESVIQINSIGNTEIIMPKVGDKA